MIKRGLCTLVLASITLLPARVEDCKPPKNQNMSNYEEVIKSIHTVEQAEIYLLNYLQYSHDIDNYGEEDYIASFKVINERRKDDCDGGALAAAALLSDDGYSPLMLFMNPENKKEPGHAIFIYRENGLIGCLGISKTDCIRPRFHSLEEITRYFGFKEYGLINLDDVSSNWKNGNYNLGYDIYPQLRFTKVQE